MFRFVTTSSQEWISLDAHIGKTVQRLRKPRSQDALAGLLRLISGDQGWTRSVVAALENGGRKVSLEDLLILAQALMKSPSDLIGPSDVPINVGGLLMTPRNVRRLLKGGTPTNTMVRAGAAKVLSDELDKFERGIEESQQIRNQFRLVGEREVRAAVEGELEKRLAKHFGISALDVVVAGCQIWHRPPTAERDRRAAERGIKSAKAKWTIYAELVDELEQGREEFWKAGGSISPKRKRKR
ncbi:MAG: helix-turn-helix transcriptional regulator [Actinomycetota bacterium]